MISETLTFVTDFLNREMKLRYGQDNDYVVSGGLINPDGSMNPKIESKIAVSIINLEHETTMKSNFNYTKDGNGGYGVIAPPVHLNIYLLISSNYSGDYIEAYKMLSSVITILQANPYFSKQENPDMKDPLEKLTFEIYNLPINELSHIWSGIGAKYVPSIIYKVRMMAIQDNKIKKEVPGITGLGSSTKPN